MAPKPLFLARVSESPPPAETTPGYDVSSGLPRVLRLSGCLAPSSSYALPPPALGGLSPFCSLAV